MQMDTNDVKTVRREILLGFWKAYILLHAAEGPVVGQWMLRELRRQGYEVSPGTINPLLARLQERGWLRCKRPLDDGLRARKIGSPRGRIGKFLRAGWFIIVIICLGFNLHSPDDKRGTALWS